MALGRGHIGIGMLVVIGGVALAGALLQGNKRPPETPITTTSAKPKPTKQAAPDLTGRASVIDGDTIEIHGRRIRLGGIDAPEGAQQCELNGASYKCGQKAALFLSDLLAEKTVRCEKTGTDRYRRFLATCFVGSEDANERMVSEGWAIAYRKYSRQYVAAEELAKERKRGIWAGTFVEPEAWRKRKGK